MADIVAGASAGGINGIFLARAIATGQSLDPLTELWLKDADVDYLLDPDARPLSAATKFWAVPIAGWMMKKRGNVIDRTVGEGAQDEVRAKLSRLVRARWFEPPFGGIGFSRLLCEALEAMRAAPAGAPLLPPGHPVDLFVTATDFAGHLQELRLNSPPRIEESEHRVSLGFRAATPVDGGAMLANPLELIFAARATASFPGAFPALRLAEIVAGLKESNDLIVAVNGKASEDLNNYTQAYEKDLQQVGVQRNDVVTVAQADVTPPVVPAKKGKNPPKVAKKKDLPVVPREAVTTEKSIQTVQAKQAESKQVASAGKAQMEGACRDPNLVDWAPVPCPNV